MVNKKKNKAIKTKICAANSSQKNNSRAEDLRALAPTPPEIVLSLLPCPKIEK